MNDPEHRYGQGQYCGRGALTPHLSRSRGEGTPPTFQSSAHKAKQREAGQHVNKQVERVITPYVQAAQGIVYGKRQVDQRPATHGKRNRWRQNGSKMLDRRVVRDRLDVVEDK